MKTPREIFDATILKTHRTKRELAECAGINLRTLENILSGAPNRVSRQRITNLCRVTLWKGLPPNERLLIFGPDVEIDCAGTSGGVEDAKKLAAECGPVAQRDGTVVRFLHSFAVRVLPNEAAAQPAGSENFSGAKPAGDTTQKATRKAPASRAADSFLPSIVHHTAKPQMQLTISKLTTDQKSLIVAAKESLQNTLTALKSSKVQLDETQGIIAEVEAKYAAASAQADRDTDAAATMLALKAQHDRLKPQIQKLTNAFEVNLSRAARFIGSVRQEIIQAQFANALAKGLDDEIETIMAPYFSQRGHARQVFYQTNSRGMLMAFLQRREPSVPDWPTAEMEIAAALRELSSLLSGEPLVDVTPFRAAA